MAKAKLALLATVYRNTGTYDTPVWTEVTGISDYATNPTFDEADSTAKGQGGVGTSEPTILRNEITGKIREDESNGAYTAFETAFWTRAAMDLLILSGPIGTVGSRGYRADWKFFAWTQDQSLPNVLFNDFTKKWAVGNPVKRAVINVADVVTYTTLTVAAA